MSTHFDLNNSCSSTNFPPSAAGPNSSFFIIIEYCITFEWKWNVPKEPSVCSSIQHGIILCFCKFLLSQSGLGSCRADTKTPKFGFQFHQMPIRAFLPSLSLSLFHDCRFLHSLNPPHLPGKGEEDARARTISFFWLFSAV